MKKRMSKLVPMADALTRLVDKGVASAKEHMKSGRPLVPVLFYFRDGEEHSVPMDYGVFVAAGKQIRRRTPKGIEHISQMGYPFAFLSMELAERSGCPARSREDRAAFQAHVEAILFNVAPQSIVVMGMVKRVAARSPLEAILGSLLGIGPAKVRPGIMVVGRNPVRSHGKIIPLRVKRDGTLRYFKEEVLDSLLGHRQVCGIFKKIFRPSFN